MNTQQLCQFYASNTRSEAFLHYIADANIRHIRLDGLIASAAPLFFAALRPRLNATLLFILPDADEAGYFYNDINQLLGEGHTLFFPSSYRRAVKYGQKDAANEILRTETLARLSALQQSDNEETLFIVTYPQAIAEGVVEQEALNTNRLQLSEGDRTDQHLLAQRLRTLGFNEVDYVYEPGQFAIRGSIVDIYSFSSELPYRIDFFGDDIDSIRTFTVEDQLSKDKKKRIEIVPEMAGYTERKASVMSYLPARSFVVMKEYRQIHDAIEKTYNEGFAQQAVMEQMEKATEQEREAIRRKMTAESTLCTAAMIDNETARFRHLYIGAHTAANNHDTTNKAQTATITFNIQPQPLYHKNFQLVRQSFTDYLLQQYKIFILADSEKQHQRLKDIFNDMDSDHERRPMDSQRSGITFEAVNRTLHEGFVDKDMKACLFTDHQLFDRFHKYNLKSDKARMGKIALTMKELQEMEVGDFIVHIDYGIGKFGGLVRIPIPNSLSENSEQRYQEVIRIIYQNNDKVDVSIHSLYKISKYRRADTDQPPRLSALGTGAWERIKEKAKKRIKDIARDLIRLYAKRRHEKGYAFSPDSFMQHELEAGFIYEDTPDQLKATQEVKNDMEQARPMDRLICGDVGFGKTEIAVRAAFKAAADSKQVAVLVPTTVLAMQHYRTFKNRLKDLPVRVEYLSRARTAKQTREICQDLEAGKIDILVGTHKILGKTVRWHDIGLLIIDEEQKFGVATKEKLRKLKTNIDTLTLSATPIPRTLQFSLMGARDMSIMRTPPPNRYPIHTELCTFDTAIIAEAINFEMSRNGQVFFVNDRISKLQELADKIRKHVPDCRIAIGHGQMSPEELEKIIVGFIDYDYDVLLSTTIVENGIDIPNANTIIINDAHHFGLSDLHQMRGRVGRSNRKAFCYLLAPPRAYLTADARKRLEALETFSDLGSGFNLAMQDLDIRGAGNLLGAEQSGFMEDLGYETYQKILSQAVTELKNEEFSDMYAEEIQQQHEISGDDFVEDCTIESDLQMYFPETYIPGSAERMLLYRELDEIKDDATLEAYRKKLTDRFGDVPQQGDELMRVVQLRRIGKQLGCEKIILKQGMMSLQFVSYQDSPFYQSTTFGKIIKYVMANSRRCNFKDTRGHRLIRINDVNTVAEAVDVLKAIRSVS